MATMTNTIDSIINDIRICIVYVNMLISSPVVSVPSTTNCAPNQPIAMMHAYMASCIIGPLSTRIFSAFTNIAAPRRCLQSVRIHNRRGHRP